MFRLFYLVALISIFLISLIQTGCNEKTVPATFEPPIQELVQESALSEPVAPALPRDPFAPRSLVKENVAKEKPVLAKESVGTLNLSFATETANAVEEDVWKQNALRTVGTEERKEEIRTESPAAEAVKTEPAPPLVHDVFAQHLASTENPAQTPSLVSEMEEIKTDSEKTLPATPPETLSVEEFVKPQEPQMFVAPEVKINPLRHPEDVLPGTILNRLDDEKSVQKTEAMDDPTEDVKIVQKQDTEIVPVENKKTEQKQEVVVPVEPEKTEPKQVIDTVPFVEEKTVRKQQIVVAASPTSSTSPTEENKPFDPVAVNGELFVGWEKPKLLLVFTGLMNGYVEPCGCAGMEQMKGGLSRRHTFFQELEKKNWSVLAVDAGNLNKGFGKQEELKFNLVIDEALRLMKYKATGIGDRELLLPTDALILYCVDVPDIPRRYTSANVAVMEFDPDITAPYRIFVQNGVKVGVTSVIAPSLLKNINNDEIKHDDAVQRLKAILPKLKEEKCDKKVLTIFGSSDEIKQIIKSVPGQFDYVISSDTPAEPPFRPNWIDNTMLIEVGEKGKFAIAIGLYDDPDTPYRYQRIPFDSRFKNSESIVELMQYYQNELKKTGLQGLGIKPIPNRRAAENGQFVGSKSCADCHEASYSIWKQSKHAAAWRSLLETSKPSRTYDPECIACHVVGWSPTEFLPYEHGFRGEKETPQLLDVGCESCHGPGENHVKAEHGSDTAKQEKLRQAIRLPIDGNVAKKVCMQCHDGDNSPHFNFETYWQKIVHKDKE